MEKYFPFLYFVYGSMRLPEPYTSGIQDFCDTGLVSDICRSLELFCGYDGEIAYQTSENK